MADLKSEILIIRELASQIDFKIAHTEFDIKLGFLTLNSTKNFDFSTVITFCHFLLVQPPSPKVSSLQKLFQAFDNATWLFTFLIFTLAFVSSYAMGIQSQRIQKFIFKTNSRLTFMKILGGIFATSNFELPSTRNFCRILWIIFLLFGIIIRSLHQATLYKFLQNDASEQGVKTIDEALMKNPTIYMHESYRYLIEDERDIKFKFLTKIDFDYFVSSGTKNFLLIPDNEFSNLKMKKWNFLSEPFYSVPVVLYFDKNFHLKEKIDKKVGELHTFGLISYWTTSINLLSEKVVYKEPSQLTLDQLSILFKILLIGCFLAGLIFIAELSYWKLTKAKKNKIELNLMSLA